MQQGNLLQTLLPFAIIAFIMWRRWKAIGKPVPLRTRRMWIMPAILTILVGLMLYAIPPGPAGWGALTLGFVIGLAAGWQRARLMHFHVDEESGMVMVRQSPLAFLFLLGLFFARRLLLPARGGPAVSHGTMPALPLITDALLGFALGMVVGMRIEMWRQTRAMRAD